MKVYRKALRGSICEKCENVQCALYHMAVLFISPPSMQPSSSLGDKDLKSTAIFEELQKHVSSIPDIVRKVKAIFLWNITKAGQLAAQWSECVQYTHCVYVLAFNKMS